MSKWARHHQIPSWKLLISSHLKQCILLPWKRQKPYWTLTSIYASNFVNLKIYIAPLLSSYLEGVLYKFLNELHTQLLFSQACLEAPLEAQPKQHMESTGLNECLHSPRS